jgi:DNA mismatch repair protein MutS
MEKDELNEEIKQNGILLYGTNAVGKSSLIKSIGICVILAQAGFFVPCESFEYKPYFSIFTRILGNDDIFKGLSTFAVEMSELRTILRMANENSLVLGDEVCSGTETISALSIFISALMELHKSNTSFIFATHFHELVDLSYLKKMKNIQLYHMAVECVNGIIKYDRKLRKGNGSYIYGLEVCKSLHMPQKFLKQAHKIRNEIYPEGKNVLQLKQSRYNSRKLKGNCQICDKIGVDIHHMNPQENADKNGFIGHFHKNHLANLMNICKECHLEVTQKNIIHKRVKTSSGYKLELV